MIAQNDAAPAANGGHIANPRRPSYPRPMQSAPGRLGARLSPRRKLYAQHLLTFLWLHRGRWQDRQVRLVPNTYAVIAEELELDRFAADQAVDDLYALGLIDVRMYGTTQVVTPLASNIEEAA